MKKILITGANSYVGTSIEKWLKQWPKKYSVDTIDMIDGNWKQRSFFGYDVVIHVAGVAHKKETRENTQLYYKINRDLAYEVALKSKDEGVKQLVFLSSMSVYGIETGIITKDTVPLPKSNYGKSKLMAEELIAPLETDSLKIAVVRPPMIYGKGCKGNYTRLERFALKSPVFPKIENERSMIYIDNLCQFIKLLIDNCSRGLFFPQNEEYVCTSEMVKLIAETHEKKIFMTRIFNPLLKILKVSTVNKVFGSLVYEKALISKENIYYTCSFEQSIKLSEK